MLYLYRVADYYEAPPNDYRIITAPIGDPIGELPDGFYSPLPNCPNCGGILVWDEAGHVSGWRTCDSCQQHYLVTTSEMGSMAKRLGLTQTTG